MKSADDSQADPRTLHPLFDGLHFQSFSSTPPPLPVPLVLKYTIVGTDRLRRGMAIHFYKELKYKPSPLSQEVVLYFHSRVGFGYMNASNSATTQ